MKKNGILNPEILAEIAALGHTEYICIADCGLPIPKGIKTIDVSVTKGVPTFTQVLETIAEELVVEDYTLADEIDERNPELLKEIIKIMGYEPSKKISHDNFKKELQTVRCVIRTGEASPFANIMLRGGVNF